MPASSTIALLAVLGLAFVAQSWAGGWNTQDGLSIFRLGSLYTPALRGGEWWRLGSYAFLHFGLAHFAMNAWALWVLMRPAEGAYGPRAALGIFAASALAGGAASAAASILRDQIGQTAGASGGVFGLFGATAAVWIRMRGHVPPHVLRAALRALGFNLLLNAALALFFPVDNFAHAGGFVCGALLGLAAPLRMLPRERWHAPVSWLLVGAAFALAAAEGAAVARAIHPVPRPLVGEGVQGSVPWQLVQVQKGLALSPAGLLAAIDRAPAAPPQSAPALQLGPRRFSRVPAESASADEKRICSEWASLVSADDDRLRVLVCCRLDACRGAPAQPIAEAIASSLRRTPEAKGP